jgi:hypothetical protein
MCRKLSANLKLVANTDIEICTDGARRSRVELRKRSIAKMVSAVRPSVLLNRIDNVCRVSGQNNLKDLLA